MSDEFERICSEVEDRTGYRPRGSAKRRKGKCPAHEDEKASLSLRDDDASGVVGVTCFAGCTFQAIAESLNLPASSFRSGRPGLMPKPRELAQGPSPKGHREIARYSYCDEDGKVLYYNVRFEPKDFRMAGPNGVISGLPKNLRRVPYNLPEVLKAVAAGKTVYWVEGEKDVATLAEHGLTGTTTAGGANSPMDSSWADLFHGATVVSVADKDKPGRAYARSVGKLLVNSAKSWRCVEPAVPQGKSDVTDHLAAGYTVADLDPLPMRSVRRTRWTIGAVLDTKPEPLNWVLPGVIPEGLTLLVGAPKAGKSWFNMGLLASLATGRPDEVFSWGQPMEPSPSLYLALEDPHRRVHDRLLKVVSSIEFTTEGAGDIWLDLQPMKDGGKEEIEKWLEKNPTARCIQVDVLAKIRGVQDTSNGLYQADYEAVGALKEIADEYGIGVVVTHHDRKKTDDDFLNMVSGTKGVTGAADTILYLQRERGSSKGTLKCESRDVEECTYRMEFIRDYGRWQIMGKMDANEDSEQSVLAQIKATIGARGATGVEELAKILDVDPRVVRRLCIQAQTDNQLKSTPDGLWEKE